MDSFEERRCENCGADINHKVKQARYCSKICQTARRFYGTYCLECKCELYVTPGKPERSTYCSPECRFKNRNPNFNEDFFAEPNLENSYWAGFIAADGCISTPQNRSLRLSLELESKDRGHLINLQSSIGAGKLYDNSTSVKSQAKLRNSSGYYLHSSKICNDLGNNFSVTPRKTLTLKPPGLSGDLATAYVAGLVDGDGSYTFNGSRPCLSIVGTHDVVFWSIGVLDTVAKILSKGNYSQAQLYGDKAIKARRRFHDLDLPLLERKKYRWEELGLDLETKNRKTKENG